MLIEDTRKAQRLVGVGPVYARWLDKETKTADGHGEPGESIASESSLKDKWPSCPHQQTECSGVASGRWWWYVMHWSHWRVHSMHPSPLAPMGSDTGRH